MLCFYNISINASQDGASAAESTIRNVDIAKEMTSYTKNNILGRSAQGMLAQANHFPQDTLQLLG